MCNNHPAPTSPWLILAHQCKYYNIACLPANCPKTTQLSPESEEVPAQQLTEATSTAYARLIHLVDPSAALVIPDSHRNFYSVRHAQHSGQTVILGAQAGLLPYGDPDLFVPFLEDKSTGLWLLPLLPPPKAHIGVYFKSTATIRYNCNSSAHCYHQHQAQIKTKVNDLSEFLIRFRIQ